MSASGNATNIENIAAVIAGVSSLIGGAVGAWLASRRERQSWLRLNQSEAFAKFLTLLSTARESATNALFDRSIPQAERSLKVTLAYSAPEEYARVVRFYLPVQVRDELQALVRSIRSLHSSVELGDSRHIQIEQELARIQEILEDAVAR